MLLNLRIPIRLRVRFTPANNPVIRLNLHKQKILPLTWIPEMSLDISHFHHKLPFGWFAITIDYLQGYPNLLSLDGRGLE